MDFSTLMPVITTFVGYLLGAVGLGMAGWITVKLNSLQKKAATDAAMKQAADSIKQQEAEDAALLAKAQSHFATMQKIGQVAAGDTEQNGKGLTGPEKLQMAQTLIQTVLLPQAGETASPQEMLPHVLAGVAALPATNATTLTAGTDEHPAATLQVEVPMKPQAPGSKTFTSANVSTPPVSENGTLIDNEPKG